MAVLNLIVHELAIPGRIQGKEIVDVNIRKIGVIRGFRIKFPPLRVYLIIRGKNTETEVPIESIDKITSNVVKINMPLDNLEELGPNDILELIKEVKDEIITEVQFYS